VGYYTYSGPVLASALPGLQFPPDVASGSTTLDAWGAKAVAFAKPTNALVDLSTTLGELISGGGFPKLIGRASYWAKGVKDHLERGADDYLNVQFGYAPVVSDIVGFANVVTLFQSLVKQYERDAGKMVRRKYSFEPVTSDVTSTFQTGVIPYINPSIGVVFNGVVGTVTRRRQTTIRRWFSGAFTYGLPPGYSSRRSFYEFGVEARKMLSLSLTPETLWNLAPWSWAVDWFASAGDVISNMSDFVNDDLVMRYGYIMEHSIVHDTYSWYSPQKFNSGAVPSSVHVVREVKVRRRANPFGFGLTWGGLSPRQLSIAAALGITRS